MFDTMDASRPHYQRAWPPVLYAVSLWLHETGFTSVDKDDSRPANMKVDDSDVSRFHLLIGIVSSLELMVLIITDFIIIIVKPLSRNSRHTG